MGGVGAGPMGGVGAGLRSGGAAAVFGANMGEPPKKGEKTNKQT